MNIEDIEHILPKDPNKWVLRRRFNGYIGNEKSEHIEASILVDRQEYILRRIYGGASSGTISLIAPEFNRIPLELYDLNGSEKKLRDLCDTIIRFYDENNRRVIENEAPFYASFPINKTF
jgi:hypothetical protein